MIYVRTSLHNRFGCRVITLSTDSSNGKKFNLVLRIKEQLTSELVHMYTKIYLYVVYNYILYTLRLQEVKSGILVCVYILICVSIDLKIQNIQMLFVYQKPVSLHHIV